MSEKELKQNFISILSKGAKSNTYKFALARFLLDYTIRFESNYIENKILNNEKEFVSYQDIANAFLRYYWHQECRYRVRQNYDAEKLPSVISIIRNVFGEKYVYHCSAYALLNRSANRVYSFNYLFLWFWASKIRKAFYKLHDANPV